MSVGRIATRVVATASPSESVLDVALRMAESNVGCVVVGGRRESGGGRNRHGSGHCDPHRGQGARSPRDPIWVIMSRDVHSVDDVMQLLAEETDSIGKLLKKEEPTMAATG